MTIAPAQTEAVNFRLYDDEAERLLSSDQFPDKVTMLPGAAGQRTGERIRILWGQDLIRDLLDGRYRTVICGVNDRDNSHGIVAQVVELLHTSQWTPSSVTSYAKMFQDSVSVHAAADKEPYVLKYDLIAAGARHSAPKGKATSPSMIPPRFRTVSKMLSDRRERQPAATVSFSTPRPTAWSRPMVESLPSKRCCAPCSTRASAETCTPPRACGSLATWVSSPRTPSPKASNACAAEAVEPHGMIEG